MKVLCDRMLGTLAKWIRIFGIDTYYPKEDVDDSELIKISKEENRTLITRDKELVYNAKRENVKVIKIDSAVLEDQIEKVLSMVTYDPEKYLSRCLVCNSLLSDVDRDKIKTKIPKYVFENNKKFWFCEKCKKIYWKGTHCENMLSKLKQITN